MTNPIQTKTINLDLDRLKRDARRINTKITKAYSDLTVPDNKYYQNELAKQLEGVPMSSKYHDYYNALTFPYQEIHQLYLEACTFFKEVNQYDQPYCVHAWLNYLEKGDSIPWHNHWGALSGLHETYVCSYYINAEPSKTIYKFPDATYDMTCENNTITLYEDVGDVHMVEPWTEDEPRISISMDFVPLKYVHATPFVLNTWMPVV